MLLLSTQPSKARSLWHSLMCSTAMAASVSPAPSTSAVQQRWLAASADEALPVPPPKQTAASRLSLPWRRVAATSFSLLVVLVVLWFFAVAVFCNGFEFLPHLSTWREARVARTMPHGIVCDVYVWSPVRVWCGAQWIGKDQATAMCEALAQAVAARSLVVVAAVAAVAQEAQQLPAGCYATASALRRTSPQRLMPW